MERFRQFRYFIFFQKPQDCLKMSDSLKLQQVLKTIDPQIKLTPEAERMIMMMANDFLMDVTDGSCSIADMRGSNYVEMKDLALYLKKNWDIDIEGYLISTTNSGIGV